MEEYGVFSWQSLSNLARLCIEFSSEEDLGLRDAAVRVGEALGIVDLDAFAQRQVKSTIEDGLGLVFDPEEAEAVARVFSESCGAVMELAVGLAENRVDAPEFTQRLNEICLKNSGDLCQILQKGLDLPNGDSELLSGRLGKATVSIYCFAAAYKIYQRAALDARLARERRIEIERLSAEMIEQLKARRAEMEELLSSRLLDRLLPFGEGVAAIDRALMENDDEGFIAANKELWELFGRHAQYSSADEFDHLMLSDEAFRL